MVQEESKAVTSQTTHNTIIANTATKKLMSIHLTLMFTTANSDGMKYIKWKFIKAHAFKCLTSSLLLALLMIVAIPFIANPPGYVAARRNLGVIYARAAGESDDDTVKGKEGEVFLWDQVAFCPQCNRPFIWFTHPKDGSVIKLNQPQNSGHPKKFFVACEKPHHNGKDGFCLTTEPESCSKTEKLTGSLKIL